MTLNDSTERQQRIEKAKRLIDCQIDPYPSRVERTYSIKEALKKFSTLMKTKKEIDLVGRIISLRQHGGSTFFDLQDASQKIQAWVSKKSLGPKAYQSFLDYFDVGDFVGIRGSLFETKTGEKTIEGRNVKILTKSFRPLPGKWYGLNDVEIRYRKRYLDLLLNTEVREIFETRSKIIREIRSFLDNHNFLEVETPILQAQYGGAKARPFKTHLSALDMDLYLRISPELYLKELLIGGFEKIYEIGRNFRNEGIDRSHNPEFTSLEFYWAYADYKEAMQLTEEMFSQILEKVVGSLTINYDGKEIDFTPPWPRIEFNQLIQKYADLDLEEINITKLKEKAKTLGVSFSTGADKPEIADQIYKKYCRPKIWQPTFIIHHPQGSFPLAKESKKVKGKTDNFQLVVANWELINAFSEQNNPLAQREIFEKQEKNFQQGLEEAQRMNEDFLVALEQGMPPAAGLGLGIDRLVALLTNSHSLREVIFFPTMKRLNDK